MEFADPIVAQEELPQDKKEVSQENAKTEEVMTKLEGDIDHAYTSIEEKLSGLWLNASKNAQDLQSKYKLDEKRAELLAKLNDAKSNINNNKLVQDNLQAVDKQLKDLTEQFKGLDTKVDFQKLSSQANNALDTLDSKLELVEKQAGRYVSQFASFFSGIVSVEAKEESREPETIFTQSVVDNPNYGSSRFDSELFRLHTTEKLYLDGSKDDEGELKAFNVEAKTDEISGLLKKYSDTLERLMNKLVPVEIPYNVFWYRYFKMEADIKHAEQSRKELLTKKVDDTTNDGPAHDDEEEFTWDDEEDEEDVVKVEKKQKDESA